MNIYTWIRWDKVAHSEEETPIPKRDKHLYSVAHYIYLVLHCVFSATNTFENKKSSLFLLMLQACWRNSPAGVLFAHLKWQI